MNLFLLRQSGGHSVGAVKTRDFAPLPFGKFAFSLLFPDYIFQPGISNSKFILASRNLLGLDQKKH